jgi:hypothetical protein
MQVLMWVGLAIIGIFAVKAICISRDRSEYQWNGTFSREEIIAKVNFDFSADDRHFVIEQLERLGALGERDCWVGQAQFSALVLAAGDAAALPEHIELGMLDTRDLIVKAGMG